MVPLHSNKKRFSFYFLMQFLHTVRAVQIGGRLHQAELELLEARRAQRPIQDRIDLRQGTIQGVR